MLFRNTVIHLVQLLEVMLVDDELVLLLLQIVCVASKDLWQLIQPSNSSIPSQSASIESIGTLGQSP